VTNEIAVTDGIVGLETKAGDLTANEILSAGGPVKGIRVRGGALAVTKRISARDDIGPITVNPKPGSGPVSVVGRIESLRPCPIRSGFAKSSG
jgi:hypothetical protein